MISFRTGGIITGIVGILIQPWKLISDPSGYIFTWLIAYSSLLGAIGGILIADYFVLRKTSLDLPGLYRKDGPYWYAGGFNTRSPRRLGPRDCPERARLPGHGNQVECWPILDGSLQLCVVHRVWRVVRGLCGADGVWVEGERGCLKGRVIAGVRIMLSVQRTLLFRVDACPGSPLIEGSRWLERGVEAACVHDDSVHRFRKQLARRFRQKIQGAWISATLGESLRPLLDHVEELAGQGLARLGSGYLTERLADWDQCPWYRIEPPLEFNDGNRKSGNVQLLSHPWQVYASEHFRSVADAENLRGLVFGQPSFGPIRGDPRAWFACLAGALAGRGLDHEWAPPSEKPAREGNGRLGEDSAQNDTAAVDRLDPVVAALCGQFPPGPVDPQILPEALGRLAPRRRLRGHGEPRGHGRMGGRRDPHPPPGRRPPSWKQG